MYYYVIMIKNGNDIPQNNREIAKIFKMAHDNGDKDAMFEYTTKLKDGIGFSKDKKEAKRYIKMADK